MATIGDRIREVRTRQNRSAHSVSVAAGLSKNTVWELESNPDRSPSVENLKAIARALGVSEIWLMNGERSNSDMAGFRGTEVAEWVPRARTSTRPNMVADVERIVKMLAPYARAPATFRLGIALPDFALADGDILIVDLNSRPSDGDLVLATMTDVQNATQISLVRRLFSPYLISARLEEPNPVLLADGTAVQVRGKICASFRAPDVVA